jgi:hypothetical protein
MKQFTIEISHASPGQLQAIASELKTMSNGWEKHGPQIVINKQQKKFTLEVSHASPGQLQTIGLELKILGNNWEKSGTRWIINGQQVQAPSLRIPGSSRKQQATSHKHHNMNTFI